MMLAANHSMSLSPEPIEPKILNSSLYHLTNYYYCYYYYCFGMNSLVPSDSATRGIVKCLFLFHWMRVVLRGYCLILITFKRIMDTK